MVTSDLRAEVEIWPFRACAVHRAIIVDNILMLNSILSGLIVSEGSRKSSPNVTIFFVKS